jgi:hypothetical protein
MSGHVDWIGTGKPDACLVTRQASYQNNDDSFSNVCPRAAAEWVVGNADESLVFSQWPASNRTNNQSTVADILRYA